MKQILFSTEEIHAMQCTEQWHRDENGEPVSHYVFGEKRCRRCGIYFKKQYAALFCVNCHRRLGVCSRFFKGEDQKVRY